MQVIIFILITAIQQNTTHMTSSVINNTQSAKLDFNKLEKCKLIIRK